MIRTIALSCLIALGLSAPAYALDCGSQSVAYKLDFVMAAGKPQIPTVYRPREGETKMLNPLRTVAARCVDDKSDRYEIEGLPDVSFRSRDDASEFVATAAKLMERYGASVEAIMVAMKFVANKQAANRPARQ